MATSSKKTTNGLASAFSKVVTPRIAAPSSSTVTTVTKCATKDVPKYTRLMIYANEVYKISYTGFTMTKLVDEAKKHLGVDSSTSFLDMASRQRNFKIFETNHFQKLPSDPIDAAALIAREQPFKIGTKSYRALKKYSETDYGSLMIERVINDKDNKPFTIFTWDHHEAVAHDHYIRLPSNFPSVTHYSIGKQRIHPQAVIHHEFEHTIYGTVINPAGSITDEIAAVTQHENPIRIIDGYEPRYTYYDADSNSTAEVTTGTIRTGKFKFDPNDPRILIP